MGRNAFRATWMLVSRKDEELRERVGWQNGAGMDFFPANSLVENHVMRAVECMNS